MPILGQPGIGFGQAIGRRTNAAVVYRSWSGAPNFLDSINQGLFVFSRCHVEACFLAVRPVLNENRVGRCGFREYQQRSRV
jgi:hypothetical protein